MSLLLLVTLLGCSCSLLTLLVTLLVTLLACRWLQWERTSQPAILWAGVGNTYSFNHIHDAPHNGILGGGNEATCSGTGSEPAIVEKMCGGNDCVFESNVIEHTNYECDDSGSFYTCGQQGTAFINRGSE